MITNKQTITAIKYNDKAVKIEKEKKHFHLMTNQEFTIQMIINKIV